MPDAGVQATDTVPCPFRLSGTEYVTVVPALVRAETVTGAGQVTSGASATGAGGVGALGVLLLHPMQQTSATSVRNDRIVSPPLVLQLVSDATFVLPSAKVERPRGERGLTEAV